MHVLASFNQTKFSQAGPSCVELNKDIDEKQKAELVEFLLEYSDLFIENPKKTPEARVVSIQKIVNL